MSELYALDSNTFAIRWRYEFEIGRDVHSIALGHEGLYAISTGTDELLGLALDGERRIASEKVYWRPDPDGKRADLHHLNSVACRTGRVIVSGLGASRIPRHSGAQFERASSTT